jgi:hypothetical protein
MGVFDEILQDAKRWGLMVLFGALLLLVLIIFTKCSG